MKLLTFDHKFNSLNIDFQVNLVSGVIIFGYSQKLILSIGANNRNIKILFNSTNSQVTLMEFDKFHKWPLIASIRC